MGLIANASEVDALAAQVPDTAGVQVVPAFTGLGAPHWDPDARGAILGLTRGADRRHVARAVLESIALQCEELLRAMQKDSGKRLPRLRVDGGAARSGLLLQMQADLLQRPVVRPANLETTAMGAGLLAALAVDQCTMADVRAGHAGDTEVQPAMAAREANTRMARWARAVASVRGFH
jgi:glycerol kinase